MKWIVVTLVLAAACKDSDQRISAGGPAGPGEGQSRKEAMELLCNAETKSGASGPEKSRDIAIWIEANVHHPEVIGLMTRLATMDRSAANQTVRDLAKKSGVASCPFAETP